MGCEVGKEISILLGFHASVTVAQNAGAHCEDGAQNSAVRWYALGAGRMKNFKNNHFIFLGSKISVYLMAFLFPG